MLHPCELFYNRQCLLANPFSLFCPSPHPSLPWRPSVCSLSVSLLSFSAIVPVSCLSSVTAVSLTTFTGGVLTDGQLCKGPREHPAHPAGPETGPQDRPGCSRESNTVHFYLKVFLHIMLSKKSFSQILVWLIFSGKIFYWFNLHFPQFWWLLPPVIYYRPFLPLWIACSYTLFSYRTVCLFVCYF